MKERHINNVHDWDNSAVKSSALDTKDHAWRALLARINQRVNNPDPLNQGTSSVHKGYSGENLQYTNKFKLGLGPNEVTLR